MLLLGIFSHVVATSVDDFVLSSKAGLHVEVISESLGASDASMALTSVAIKTIDIMGMAEAAVNVSD